MLMIGGITPVRNYGCWKWLYFFENQSVKGF